MRERGNIWEGNTGQAQKLKDSYRVGFKFTPLHFFIQGKSLTYWDGWLVP
jgi:hypothetical protein